MARAFIIYALLLLVGRPHIVRSDCVDVVVDYVKVNFSADEQTNATLECEYTDDFIQMHHEFEGEVIDILEADLTDPVRNYDFILFYPRYVLGFQPTVTQRHQGAYFCVATTCNLKSNKVYIDVEGAPFLEYQVSLGTVPPPHMNFTKDTTETLMVKFHTFASPTATVSLYKQQPDDTYQLHTNDRTATTSSYVSISNLLPDDQGSYLITADNSFGPSINNLTFNLTVIGVGPPTVTIDPSLVVPSAYSEHSCLDSQSIDGESPCQVKCSVPRDAYSELDGSLTVHWEFDSKRILPGDSRRQVQYLDQDPPHVLLIFDSFSETMNGEYSCVSNNTYSGDIDSVILIGPPARITDLNARSTETSSTVSLEWTIPDSFGARITQYKIEYGKVDDSNKTVHLTEEGTTSPFPIHDLCPSGFYSFTIAAINEYGVPGEFADVEEIEIFPDSCTTASVNNATTIAPSTGIVTDRSTANLTTIIGGAIGGLVLLVIVSMVLFGGIYCYRAYARLSSRGRHAETRWTPPSEYYEDKSPEPMMTSIGTCIPSLATPAYDFCNIDAQYEFPPENLELTDILLDGTYSVIYKANAQGIHEDKTIEVAVKTIKDEFTGIDDYMSHLMLEMEQMANMDPHPNVVKLLKVCTVGGGPIYMVMEYMCHGDLLGFLRTTRGHDNMYTVLPGMKEMPKLKLTSRDLLNIITQVASGMRFLSENKIVHGHLCARNVLVSTNMEVKVFNVGLYNLHNEETYETTVRWLAPELFGPNTMRTMFGDIWAFGILMWEVVTLGGTPYAEIKAHEIYPHLLDGMRLQRPPHCAQPVYDMMSQCWGYNPNARPLFSDIYNALTNLNLSKMSYLDLRNYNDSIYSQFDSSEKEPMSVL